MLILDMSAGPRAIWWEKNHPNTVYLDIGFNRIDEHGTTIKNPDIVADTRAMPFRNGTFDLIVYDPPHCKFNRNSQMGLRYGNYYKTVDELRSAIRGSVMEANRVAKESCVMAFKWNNHDISFSKIFGIMYSYWRVMFGDTSNDVRQRGFRSDTCWAFLEKAP